MGSISAIQWRKAYMLEFYTTDSKSPSNTFTFSVPPESENLKFAQRLTETKTLGGSIFDDFGNDSYRITLKGSTINEDKKVIYQGMRELPKYLTGTQEIFELQRIIKDFADDSTLDKKIMLYDLSKMSAAQIVAGTTGKNNKNYWQVFINDFSISRDKSKPFTFNYTLEMIAIEPTQTNNRLSYSFDVADVLDNINEKVAQIQKVASYAEGATNLAKELTTEAINAKNKYLAIVNKVSSQIENENTFGAVSTIIGTTANVADGHVRIISGDNGSFYNSAKNVLELTSTFRSFGKDTDSEDFSVKRGKTESTSKFTVSFNSMGGSSVKSQSIEYGKRATEPTAPTKENYSFVAWYSDSTLKNIFSFTTPIGAHITLYAKWTLAVALITFETNGGDSVPSQSVKVGQKAIEPINPTRHYYDFVGWYKGSELTIEFDFNSLITDNLTLYARWQLSDNVTAIFYTNGGGEIESQTVKRGECVIYPKTPTKDNFVFYYWCIDSTLKKQFDFSTPIDSDISLFAKWIQVSNTVYFNSNGGSEVESQTVLIGKYATKPQNPTREGFNFVFWCDDKDLTNEFIFATQQVNKELTLYAKWQEIICTVNFDSRGGSEISAQSVTYGNKIYFPLLPSKNNDIFLHWAEKDGNEYKEFDFNKEIKSDLVLYAQWYGDSQ